MSLVVETRHAIQRLRIALLGPEDSDPRNTATIQPEKPPGEEQELADEGIIFDTSVEEIERLYHPRPSAFGLLIFGHITT